MQATDLTFWQIKGVTMLQGWQKYKGKVMTEQQIIGAMIEYPQLIERPIVIINKKAIIARPPQKVLILFN